jgi:hypothetical protein
MAHRPRAAVSCRGSQRDQAAFGQSTLVSWQLIVENEPTERFASRPKGDVTLTRPQQDADGRQQPQSPRMGNEWAAAHTLMFAQRAGSASMAKDFWPYRCFLE